MNPYEQHYLIEQALAKNPRLIPSINLADLNRDQIYAAYMDSLSQNLPSGKPSPFSSQDPGTGHALLGGALIHLLELHYSRLNLLPDASYIRFLRLLGVERMEPQYMRFNMEFRRNPATVGTVQIPLGVTIRSRYQPGLAVITTEAGEIPPDAIATMIPARLDRLGGLDEVRTGEFSVLPSSLPGVQSVSNVEILSYGKEEESLADAALRIREGIRTGSLGHLLIGGQFNPLSPEFVGRCVTGRDFEYYGLALGAMKVLYQPPGITSLEPLIAIYPGASLSILEQPLRSLCLEGEIIDIVPAEVIPVDGTVKVKIVPNLSDNQAFDLAARAIMPQWDTSRIAWADNAPRGLNPPAGIWGDPDFAKSLAATLENVDGFYAVPEVKLRHSKTGQPLETLDVKPWHLFELQNSVEFEFVR